MGRRERRLVRANEIGAGCSVWVRLNVQNEKRGCWCYAFACVQAEKRDWLRCVFACWVASNSVFLYTYIYKDGRCWSGAVFNSQAVCYNPT